MSPSRKTRRPRTERSSAPDAPDKRRSKRRALLSVADKHGLAPFALALERARLRDRLDGRHGQSAAGGGNPRDRGRDDHGLSRDHGRPRQDAASAHSRRLAGTARRRRRRAREPRHRRHRLARRESLSIRGDDGAPGLHRRRSDREHRRRRPRDAARRREESRAHRRSSSITPTTTPCSRRSRTARFRPHAPRARDQGVQPHGALRRGDQPLLAHS